MKYNLENMTAAVAQSVSWAEVCRSFGKDPRGGSRGYLKKKAESFDLDTSHFLGQKWVKKYGSPNVKPSSHFLREIIDRKVVPPGPRLRKALIDMGRKYECSSCHLGPEWNNAKLVLQVDHINGKRFDCREENLRFLCPNCHSQTETWGTKNRNNDNGA